MTLSEEITKKTFAIRRLTLDDAQDLGDMLMSLSDEYCKYFSPFSFEIESITSILSKAVEDLYWGLFFDDKLVGFFMLRGFDEGYTIPSYGIIIEESFSNKGLANLSLQFCITWCRMNGINNIMLKVHPDNANAKHIYEKQGFIQEGLDLKNNNLIYYKDLN